MTQAFSFAPTSAHFVGLFCALYSLWLFLSRHVRVLICRHVLVEEFAVLENTSDEPFSLEGCYIADIIGHHKSRPFGSQAVVEPHDQVTIWTAPGRVGPKGLEEDAHNIFWKNLSNNKPRAQPVLNNSGDGVNLLNAKGDIIASIAVEEPGAAATSKGQPAGATDSASNVVVETSTEVVDLSAVPRPRTPTRSISTGSAQPTNSILGPDRQPYVRQLWLEMLDSDTGFKLKSSEGLSGVSLSACPGGRDCARLSRCDSEFPNICFDAQECFDPIGKKRCTTFEPCQCLMGNFSTVFTDNGFRFFPAAAPFDAKEFDAVTERPDIIIKRDYCVDGTFNMRACEPLEMGCESIVPCLKSDVRACQSLVPGM
ncbi:uncharacterized protein MONBRDRAFT_8065 [Monosiga brevicollis MX1]|uniref:LTD domain-containing protein n=1 Tax=Monosiga brevicollis TaxID=81824 RepID=A9UYY2_MONBE|nr:uncharacterized protein MONBRDRAFT_8065 [Monosiga brevicollis MX1]EDQ89688.1 predicted protein [Monosiga brevicollis MX1]|eukprot:XP_001745717.1 hypothetical protein [Monosiga brevicollis MX1]